MYKVTLKNKKNFECKESETIFEAAKSAGILLEHSCLAARCSSCIVKIISGTSRNRVDDLVLTDVDKADNFILSCNSIPTSDMEIDIIDIDYRIVEKKIVPAKIEDLVYLNDDVINVKLRLPPNSNFNYIEGQYVNISKGTIKRSYSIANACKIGGNLEFIIKKYEFGLMSSYWFSEAKLNDLVRIEGPFGSFFLRDSEVENIIFLATGTGVAPVKAILEQVNSDYINFSNKKIWVFYGARCLKDIFWHPENFDLLNLKSIMVLSKENSNFEGYKGYVQDALLNERIDLKKSLVYACGSSNMITDSKRICIKNNLPEENFFSDAFLCSK